MPTLKLGSTTALTESSGALTINVANPTVTLGSNATFNAPNLGTPSAVTLTNATFPAGHVIQVVPPKTGSGYDQTNSTDYQNSGVYESITFTAGNKILVIAHANLLAKDGGQDASVKAKLYNSTAGTYFGHEVELFIHSNASIDHKVKTSSSITAITQPSGTSATFYIRYKAGDGGNIRIYNEYSSLTLIELQA
jgi:hypothetical protein